MQDIQNRDSRIDQLEAIIVNELPQVDCPIKHIFTEGLYAREMSAPAGALITSKIHKTEHIFILSKGVLSLFNDNGEEVLISAPYTGITKAGTRRVAYIHEDIIWTTFHANPENENENEIENRIIEKRENKLINSNKKEIQ